MVWLTVESIYKELYSGRVYPIRLWSLHANMSCSYVHTGTQPLLAKHYYAQTQMRTTRVRTTFRIEEQIERYRHEYGQCFSVTVRRQ